MITKACILYNDFAHWFEPADFIANLIAWCGYLAQLSDSQAIAIGLTANRSTDMYAMLNNVPKEVGGKIGIGLFADATGSTLWFTQDEFEGILATAREVIAQPAAESDTLIFSMIHDRWYVGQGYSSKIPDRYQLKSNWN